MNLQMGREIAEKYTSASQKIRVITEQWVKKNLYCPCCGKMHVSHFEKSMSYNKTNLKVIDFLMVPKYFFRRK